MFGWPWSKKESKPMVPPPPPVTPSFTADFAPLGPPAPRSAVAEHMEHLPPLPFSDEPAPAPAQPVRMTTPPPIPKPVAALDSLRASIEASIAQRSEERSIDQSSLDAKASSPFHAADNTHFSTLREFGNALLLMDDATFNHHVNHHKNDFANWIEHCFEGNTKRIGTMLRGKSRQEMARLFNYALQTPVQRTETYATAELNLAPLPPSPLEETSEHRVQRIQQLLNAISSQAQSDPVSAKDLFINARTRIWQELSDDERHQVMPQLRTVYEKLRYTR